MLIARIGHYDEHPDPFFSERGNRVLDISEGTRKCVAFIGIRKDGEFRPKATAFFVNYLEDQHYFDHIVTAEHVVSGLITAGHDLWLRANTLSGGVAELPIAHDAFYYHPNSEIEPTDVAVAPLPSVLVANNETGKEERLDIRTLPLNDASSYAPNEEFRKHSLGLGGQIVIVGLFRSHYGKNRNIPIVRVGNIAARPEEPVWTRYAGYMTAYLIEARSIAGLSGSPVFALMDPTQLVVNALTSGGTYNGQTSALLGLVHGHFDVKNLNEDVVVEGATSSIHTGIGVVIPFEKILETVEHPDLVSIRKSVVAKLREGGALPDLALSGVDAAPQPSDANPTHREDFTALLSAAARTPPQDD